MTTPTDTLSLHRCKVCGTAWLLWPAGVGGTKDASWNLLDKYQRPGACCDNALMGDQIEHLRDIPLAIAEAGCDQLKAMRQAKYLNATCALHGCQWMVAPERCAAAIDKDREDHQPQHMWAGMKHAAAIVRDVSALGQAQTPEAEKPHCENCGAVGVELQELVCRSCWEHDADGPRFHWRDGVYFQRLNLGAVLLTLPNGIWKMIPQNEWQSVVAHVAAVPAPAPAPRPEHLLSMPRWKCRQCGCLWRDNLDGSVSLFDANQKSCQDCEMLPTAESCVIEWFKSHAEPQALYSLLSQAKDALAAVIADCDGLAAPSRAPERPIHFAQPDSTGTFCLCGARVEDRTVHPSAPLTTEADEDVSDRYDLGYQYGYKDGRAALLAAQTLQGDREADYFKKGWDAAFLAAQTPAPAKDRERRIYLDGMREAWAIAKNVDASLAVLRGIDSRMRTILEQEPEQTAQELALSASPEPPNEPRKLVLPEDAPEGCTPYLTSSRVCERGTMCCTTRHVAEPPKGEAK